MSKSLTVLGTCTIHSSRGRRANAVVLLLQLQIQAWSSQLWRRKRRMQLLCEENCKLVAIQPLSRAACFWNRPWQKLVLHIVISQMRPLGCRQLQLQRVQCQVHRGDRCLPIPSFRSDLSLSYLQDIDSFHAHMHGRCRLLLLTIGIAQRQPPPAWSLTRTGLNFGFSSAVKT